MRAGKQFIRPLPPQHSASLALRNGLQFSKNLRKRWEGRCQVEIIYCMISSLLYVLNS